MWTTLALMTLSLAPAQASEPTFKNARFTYGILGQTRSDKFLPGDAVVLAFDVQGLSVDGEGYIKYAMGMEISKGGKSVLKRDLQKLEATNHLGKSNLPSYAIWPIPRDTSSPGEYTMKVTVKDGKTNKSSTLTKKFTVEKTRLGFVQVSLTNATRAPEPVPPLAVPGQRVMLHYTLVGFDLGKDKQTDVTMQIRFLDSDGKPTLSKPLKASIKSETDTPGVMVLNPMLIEMNRAGKFKVELKATCNVLKKTTTRTLDLEVRDQK